MISLKGRAFKTRPAPSVASILAVALWLGLLSGMSTFIADGYQYIRGTDGSEELYDFDHDVEEKANLIKPPSHLPQLTRLRQLLSEQIPIEPK